MYLETQSFGGSQNLPVFKGPEQLWHVLHDEHWSAGTLDDVKKWAPQLLSRITLTILVEETESLTGGASNDDVGLRNLGRAVSQNIDDIAGNAAVTEIGFV